MSWATMFNDRRQSFISTQRDSGDWKNVLSAEESAELDEIYAKRFKDVDIDFDFGS